MYFQKFVNFQKKKKLKNFEKNFEISIFNHVLTFLAMTHGSDIRTKRYLILYLNAKIYFLCYVHMSLKMYSNCN